MGLLRNNLCWKCNQEAETFIHLLWEFLPESPRLCLLGDRSELASGILKAEFGLALAGCTSQTQPEVLDWVRQMTDSASFELMIATLNNKDGNFHEVRDQFWNHIKGGNGCL